MWLLWGDGSAGLLSRLATPGGQLVQLDGANFGPASPRQFVTSVTMGGYAFVGCNVTVPHTTIVCVTPPGVGAGYRAVVTIADQVSEASLALLSYAPPSIASYDGPGAQQGNTQGGLLIYINGNNFGPVLRPTDNITYTAHVESGTNSSLPFVPVSPATNGTITFVPTNCTLSIPHEQIRTCAVGLLRASLVFAVWLSGQRFCTCFALLS